LRKWIKTVVFMNQARFFRKRGHAKNKRTERGSTINEANLASGRNKYWHTQKDFGTRVIQMGGAAGGDRDLLSELPADSNTRNIWIFTPNWPQRLTQETSGFSPQRAKRG
jgi:hypothetical protein